MSDWRCRRCGSYVYFEPGQIGGRCNCTTSPSPWEPVEHKRRDVAIILLGLVAAAFGIWWLGVG